LSMNDFISYSRRCVDLGIARLSGRTKSENFGRNVAKPLFRGASN
jgi:hypothetical protein